MEVLPVLGFVLSHGRCSTCTTGIPRMHLLSELTGAVVQAGAAVLLAMPARRELGPRVALIALLVITGVAALLAWAVLLVGVAAALTGRWAL